MSTQAIQAWRDLRTLGALKQAMNEALDVAKMVGADPETVYVSLDAVGVANFVNLTVWENTLTDGSKTYDVRMT